MLHHPYYYFDISLNDRVPYYNLDVFVSDRFIDFAKREYLNHKEFEKFSRNALQRFGYGENSIKDLEILSWVKNSGSDTGLLHSISIPGNSSQGMSLEEGIDGAYYHSHNIDTDKQFSSVLTIITNYIGSIGSRIELKSLGFDEEL